VTVHGGLFLPQVVRGRYTDVEVDMTNVTSEALTMASLHAHLDDVFVPFHDVLVRDVHRVVIRRSTERVQITPAEINAYLHRTGRLLDVAAADRPDELRITGHVRLLGREVAVSGDAAVSAADGAVEIRPTSLDTDLAALDAVSRALLNTRLTLRLPLTGLPFGQRVTGASVGAAGVEVQAAGRGIVIQP
jgi:hypothetical protein